MLRHSIIIIVIALIITACAPDREPSLATATPIPGPTPTRVPTIIPAIMGAIKQANDVDLPLVTIDADLHYAERWMQVRQSVVLTNTSADSWSEVVLSVPLHYNLDTFLLDSLEVALGSDLQQGTPSFFGRETMLRVPLPRSAAPGDSMEITIGYRVIFPPIQPTDWPPIGNTGWTEDVIQAGEWYPALIPYVDGSGWQTWEYYPVGDPTIYPLTNINLNVQVDDPNVIVASGGAAGHDGLVWRFHVSGARGIAFLASPQYRVSQVMQGDIPITSYYFPHHEQQGKEALDMAAKAIDLYSRIYGPYPYSSLAIVENGFFGGMEYSELISVTDYCYETHHGDPESCLPALIAHETAHQWWYGSVGNDQVHEPWLDEMMAFYAELLYYEHYHPEEIEWWWKTRVDIYSPYGPVDAEIYSYEKSEYFIPSMYGQAARFMRDLRRLMGEEAFFALLADYYQTNTGRMVTGDDFFQAVRRHYDGDLTPLLAAYFSRTDY
jgi:hypothetical protein